VSTYPNQPDSKTNWPAILLGAALVYVVCIYTPERERTGFYRGLCTAGQGNTDEAVDKCEQIHP
jgi:hypothetical protein